jgi:hypothetical protein
MTVELSIDSRRRGRLARILGALLVLFALAGSAFGPARAARATDEQPPLDLAAMTLTPDDLADLGMDGFGFGDGRTLAADNLADRAVWPAGEGEELAEVRDDLVAAGWRQAYLAVLTTVRDYDNPGPSRDVEIEVVAYADAAGAAQGFSLVPDAYATGEMEEVAGGETIGDESRITRIDAHDAGAGTPYAELALGFRQGNLTARVLLRNPQEEPPQVDEIEALAEALLTRIERVLEDGGPRLSLRVLRVEPKEEFTPIADAYLRLDGEDLRSAYETPDEFAARAASYADATDVFSISTEIPAHDSDYTLGFRTTLLRFAEDDLAAAWVGTAPDRLRPAPAMTEFAVTPEGEGLGDESVAVTMTSDRRGEGGDLIHSAIVVVRVGATVAEIRLDRSYDAPPLVLAKELAKEQASCMNADVCLDPRPVPVWPDAGLAGDPHVSPMPAAVTEFSSSSTPTRRPTA